VPRSERPSHYLYLLFEVRSLLVENRCRGVGSLGGLLVRGVLVGFSEYFSLMGENRADEEE
jgi:hypothetical protein